MTINIEKNEVNRFHEITIFAPLAQISPLK